MLNGGPVPSPTGGPDVMIGGYALNPTDPNAPINRAIQQSQTGVTPGTSITDVVPNYSPPAT